MYNIWCVCVFVGLVCFRVSEWMICSYVERINLLHHKKKQRIKVVWMWKRLFSKHIWKCESLSLSIASIQLNKNNGHQRKKHDEYELKKKNTSKWYLQRKWWPAGIDATDWFFFLVVIRSLGFQRLDGLDWVRGEKIMTLTTFFVRCVAAQFVRSFFLFSFLWFALIVISLDL